MKFSLIQAADHVGVSKSTMHRYLKNGKVSYAKTEAGGYEIDASELARAFPPGWKKDHGTGAGTPERDEVGQHGTPETSHEPGALRAEVKMLREMLERMDLDHERERRDAAAAIEDYRKRLDQEGEERRALNARLLTYQQPPAPPAPPPSAPTSASSGPAKRSGLFGLLRRTG